MKWSRVKEVGMTSLSDAKEATAIQWHAVTYSNALKEKKQGLVPSLLTH